MIKDVVRRLWMSEGAPGQGVACLEVKRPAAPPSKQRFQALKGLPCSAQRLSALTASLLSSSFSPSAVHFHLCHPDSMPWTSNRLHQGGSNWTATGLHGSPPLLHKRLDHVLRNAPLLRPGPALGCRILVFCFGLLRLPLGCRLQVHGSRVLVHAHCARGGR